MSCTIGQFGCMRTQFQSYPEHTYIAVSLYAVIRFNFLDCLSDCLSSSMNAATHTNFVQTGLPFIDTLATE